MKKLIFALSLLLAAQVAVGYDSAALDKKKKEAEIMLNEMSCQKVKVALVDTANGMNLFKREDQKTEEYQAALDLVGMLMKKAASCIQ
ncbi:hypothetical protein [Kangiella shandongensis]|uniref:hypothetical protein n=1 Tax=Kangiella shandongensis TaxID=2763258 RepID=UPI001CBADA85|nr:hypothetical protein [Kangiella shandongensis]